jgi:glycosyltransferase involved in cell wall biosynthesis
VSPASAARIPACDQGESAPSPYISETGGRNVTPIKPFKVLIVVPTLEAGAADQGVVDLVRILTAAGHKPVVMSSGGRLESEIAALGAKFIAVNVASKNPLVMMRNAAKITRVIREDRCDVVHAHGRAPAWSAYLAARLTGVPFVTSWYKGFREQNPLKRFYNSVMIRGDRIIAVNDQIADLICDRYGLSSSRIDVVPASIDFDRFNPASVSNARIDAVRHSFGVSPDTRVMLVVGRMLRRKGHHLIVQAARRLKDLGMKDFACVFVGEDHGRSRYMGEVWDLVLASGTADVVRMTGPVEDLPAAYAASSVVISAATQPEGLQRSILEAQAMARPVIVSDLGAGPDVVLAPPAVPDDRITGLRFSAGDDAALAAALIRLFSLTDSARQAIGMRGREWVNGHFSATTVADLTLNAYAGLLKQRRPS